MPDATSPFLSIPDAGHVASNAHGLTVADAFPVSPGHTLVVPRRQIRAWWDATPAERAGLIELIDQVKAILDQEHRPDGYNVGSTTTPRPDRPSITSTST